MKIVILILSLIGIGCGQQNKASSSDAAVIAAAVDPLEGSKWQSACSDSSVDEISFSAHKNEHKVVVYSDPECTAASFFMTVERTYSLFDNEIDYTYLSTTLTFVTQDSVDSCNADKCWGLDGWELDKARDISGLTYADVTPPKIGDMLYTIFKIEAGVLHFGDTTTNPNEKGDKIETRPHDLDRTLSFKKL